MTVSPTSRGTEADHAVVPDAVPASPLEVVHRTEATLDEAVPLTDRADAVVATMEAGGAVITSDGGVPPPDGLGDGFDGGDAGGLDGGPGDGLDGGFAGGLGVDPDGVDPLPPGFVPPDGVVPVPPPAGPYRF